MNKYENDALLFKTYGGVKIDFGKFPNLCADDFHISDIIHSLPMLCRYNGHIPFFYSVAQHSIRVSQYLKDNGSSIDVQLCGLLHDAAEAYAGDLVFPLKRCIDQYILIEDAIQSIIYRKFGLFEVWHENKVSIKNADIYIAHVEMTYFGKYHSQVDERYKPLSQDIDSARNEFYEFLKTLRHDFNNSGN